MKKVFAILFCSLYIFVAFIPFASVYATEVTWGDNNNYTMSNTQYELFEKVAVMSLIPDLLSYGINELSIENATDVDDYVDNIINYINSHAEDFTNVNTWSTLNYLNQAIQEKTQEIGNNMLANGTVTQEYNGTLSSFFEPQNNNVTNYKTEYKPNPNFVPIFQRLSNIDSDPVPTPNPSPDFSFINNINKVYADVNLITNGNNTKWLLAGDNNANITFNCANVTYYTDNTLYHSSEIYSYDRLMIYNGILTIYFDTLTNTCRYVGNGWMDSVMDNHNGYCFYNVRYIPNPTYFRVLAVDSVGIPSPNYVNFQTSFAGLSTALNYFYQHFGNINLFVDNECWAYVNTTPTNIVIDINGLDMYSGTDKPVTYYYPNGTQIDYQKLYEVIKRAIQNNTPISNQTIWEGDTYYDSHDNVYSPTIYNYYSDDDEDESSIIEDILTLAVIPEFDTALLEPLETPMLNGEKIMFTGVQAFPEDILFVLGACFVLILFGAMINRLIE